MSEAKSHDEILQEYKTAMGGELGSVFSALSDELVWLHWRWKQYRTLFGEKSSRIEMLNDAAPFFFYTVQEVLFEDTLLALARLVASPKSVGQNNLTIQRLAPLMQDASFRVQLEGLVEVAIKRCAFATDWRHRRLAHRDLALSLEQPARALEPASRQAIEEALRGLRDVLNSLQAKFMNGMTTAYELTSLIGDAEALLRVVHDGRQRRQERLQRWTAGQLDQDDLRPPAAL